MKVDQKDVKSDRSVPIKVNAKIELTMEKNTGTVWCKQF